MRTWAFLIVVALVAFLVPAVLFGLVSGDRVCRSNPAGIGRPVGSTGLSTWPPGIECVYETSAGAVQTAVVPWASLSHVLDPSQD